MNSHRVVAAGLAGLLALSACGSDESSSQSASTPATASSSASGDESSSASPPSASTAPTTESASEPASAASTEAAFPVTIEHKYGSTTIEEQPERIVSIGFGEHDGLLAMGVTPIAVRDWYGDQPFATWPWAQDELGDAEPEVLPLGDLNFEQISALDPDIILGIASGMTDSDYETLSAIAPTVAQSDEYIDYGTPWDEMLRQQAAALGTMDAAEEVIADTEDLFEQVRADYPEFDGATATVGFVYEDEPGAYASSDIRANMMREFGFTTPTEYDELAGDQFYFTVSAERLPMLDADVIVWIAADAATEEKIRALKLRPTLDAYAEGREVFADQLLSGAFSHASPLSMEYVAEHLLPKLELAIDGDPATKVESADTQSSDDSSAGDDADDQGFGSAEADAAAAAWSLAFDSAAAVDDKMPHIEQPDELTSTIDDYAEAGSAMGGISLQPTAVSVDGDVATVTYDVYFGESASYTDLEGQIDRVDGTWVVSRDEFCSFMAQARNACPSP